MLTVLAPHHRRNVGGGHFSSSFTATSTAQFPHSPMSEHVLHCSDFMYFSAASRLMYSSGIVHLHTCVSQYIFKQHLVVVAYVVAAFIKILV